MQQFTTLSLYLVHNGISSRLRVSRIVLHTMEQKRGRFPESEVDLLPLLSEPHAH